MIKEQTCPKEDVLASILHRITVRIILTEQSIDKPLPLFVEQVVALQSVDPAAGFKSMNRVSSCCAMMVKGIGSSVLLSTISGGWDKNYCLPGMENLVTEENEEEEEMEAKDPEEQGEDKEEEMEVKDPEVQGQDEEEEEDSELELSDDDGDGNNFIERLVLGDDELPKDVPLVLEEFDDPVISSQENPRQLGE